MKPATVPKPRYRLYYVVIHLNGLRVVEGTLRCGGMLEAESFVECRSSALAAFTGRSLKGYMIQQLRRKEIKRMAALYGPLSMTTDVSLV